MIQRPKTSRRAARGASCGDRLEQLIEKLNITTIVYVFREANERDLCEEEETLSWCL